MRIIAGKWRARRIEWPPGDVTRPVPSRVKEAIFGMLGNHYDCPNALPPLAVADVFAGGGSFGLEALSRGATSCVFFERDRSALAVLRRNIAAVDASDLATIVTLDAWTEAPRTAARTPTAPTPPPAAPRPPAPPPPPFELILLDPPYRDSRDTSPTANVRCFLAAVANGLAEHGPMIVLHHESDVDFSLDPIPNWRILDRRTFGTHGVTFFSK